MNQLRYLYSKGLGAFLFLFLAFTQHVIAQTKVFHLQNYFTEAYLIKGNGDQLILVDTGVPLEGYQDTLVKSIRDLGFKPENITLAIVTHGHGDHAGNARFLQEKFHVPIAGSKADLDKFTSGKTELSKSEDVSIWGSRLRPYCDFTYPHFTPDVIVDQTPVDLTKYGVNGKIIPIKGGHTPGDLLVLIGENLFVGDVFVGTFKAQGGGLVPDGHHVREHFYHENRQLSDQNLPVIEKLAIDNHVTTLYPTHNGPVTLNELSKYIREEPLLKLLSKQETDLLNDIAKGKSDLAKLYLADNFALQTARGEEYNKTRYIEAYITHPAVPFESLTAEDFRIVNSSESTVVLTYLENIKQKGKDLRTLAITEVFSKSKNGWKLTYKKSVNL